MNKLSLTYSELLLETVNAFNYAEVLFRTVFPHCEQATGIHVLGVDIDHEMLETLQLGLSILVVGKQLFHHVWFSLF